MISSILIVDDSAMVRRSVRTSIESTREWKVVGEAQNGQEAVEKVVALRPDIVILDLQMPVMNGLEAARQIAALAPNTTMLMFTAHQNQQLLQEARTAGIAQVLSKDNGTHLLTSLRSFSQR